MTLWPPRFPFSRFSSRGPTFWAAAGGLCIGYAEICDFYLFRVGLSREAVSPSVVIPIIVSGTIAITLIVSYFFLREALTPIQLTGTGLAVQGMFLIAYGAMA